MTPQSGNRVLTSLGNSGLCWTIFTRNRDTAVPAEGNGDLQTLICVLVARPRQCLTLSNPVPWQNWMAAYLGYTLRMKTLFRGWPVMAHETHTRRRRSASLHILAVIILSTTNVQLLSDCLQRFHTVLISCDHSLRASFPFVWELFYRFGVQSVNVSAPAVRGFITVGHVPACHCRHFWHATLRLRSTIRRHHPPQRVVLSQIYCFRERKMVLLVISTKSWIVAKLVCCKPAVYLHEFNDTNFNYLVSALTCDIGPHF